MKNLVMKAGIGIIQNLSSQISFRQMPVFFRFRVLSDPLLEFVQFAQNLLSR